MKLSDLKKAFQPLIEISHKEKEIMVDGVRITLRSITPKEETEIQKNLPNLDEDDTSTLEFVDVFRKQALSISIVQIQDLDLRNLEYIETGEVLDNGTPVKIRKEDAVLQIMDGWSRALIAFVFQSFSELTEELEKEVEKKVKPSTEILKAEQELLKERLSDIDRNIELNSHDTKVSEVIKDLSDVEDSSLTSALKGMGS
jgi:hypothetical protein